MHKPQYALQKSPRKLQMIFWLLVSLLSAKPRRRRELRGDDMGEAGNTEVEGEKQDFNMTGSVMIDFTRTIIYNVAKGNTVALSAKVGADGKVEYTRMTISTVYMNYIDTIIQFNKYITPEVKATATTIYHYPKQLPIYYSPGILVGCSFALVFLIGAIYTAKCHKNKIRPPVRARRPPPRAKRNARSSGKGKKSRSGKSSKKRRASFSDSSSLDSVEEAPKKKTTKSNKGSKPTKKSSGGKKSKTPTGGGKGKNTGKSGKSGKSGKKTTGKSKRGRRDSF